MSGRFLDSSMHDHLKEKTIHMYQVMKVEKPEGQHVWISPCLVAKKFWETLL